MRINLAALIVLLLLAAGCKSTYPNTTHEDLGKSVFKILRDPAHEGLDAIVASREDAESYIATADVDSLEKAQLRAELDAMLAEFREGALQTFQSVRRAAQEAGVDWEKAKFVEALTEGCRTVDTEICDISLVFSSNGKNWEVLVDDVGKAKSGWILGLEGVIWMGQVL